MFNTESRDAVIQNLIDAGCGQEMIDDFLAYYDGDKREKQLELLELQRKDLLNRIHREEKKISCLDYLIYQIAGITCARPGHRISRYGEANERKECV